ncbi:hypothetical protein [Flavobacterium sp. 3HN19-14]|uniref:hypothetical protein n=1 Tax=Flavobacterium sp. 3HN19-14 TaxID=3448133 RepID=UPI003EDEC0E3
MVYASVFSATTSAEFYSGQRVGDELFFMMQVSDDTFNNELPDTKIEQEWRNANLKHITIIHKDSAGITTDKQYYITAGHD